MDEEVRCAFAVLSHEGLEASLLWNVTLTPATLLNFQASKSSNKIPTSIRSTKEHQLQD